MIPKLALNFTVSSDSTMDFISLFDRMRANKIIYVEVILNGITKLDEIIKFSDLFKKMRNTKHIDYTIWISAGSNPIETHELFLKAKASNNLIMGLVSPTEITDIPNLRTWVNIYPDVHDLMLFNDEQTIELNERAKHDINAPEGMKRGLLRVIEDYMKMRVKTPTPDMAIIDGPEDQ